MQATVQHFSRKLGRIRDLLHELDSLALDFPNLSEVAYLKGAVLRLTFLNLEAETKFSVYLSGGGLTEYHSPLSCSAASLVLPTLHVKCLGGKHAEDKAAILNCTCCGRSRDN